MSRIAIVGGGIAGLAAAYEAARLGLDAVLFEASARLGGTVETVREQGFVVECGPDAWVTEKPWARELATELGLEAELLASNDAARKTYVLSGGRLLALPDAMRLMVPADLAAVEGSELFSAAARAAYRNEPDRAAELREQAPADDESVAAFVARHFGPEVLEKVAGPLLSGIFGGDVRKLSVRAVMPAFVAMEREFGSLITAVQEQSRRAQGEKKSVFTTLRAGTGALVEAMLARIPEESIRLGAAVTIVARAGEDWLVGTAAGVERFDALMLAAPVDVAGRLIAPVSARAAELMRMESSSAVVVGLCFAEAQAMRVPPGFGFLVPPGEYCTLLACTFMDQKFDGRVPPGGRLIRAFFGGPGAERVLAASDAELVALARKELGGILGELPAESFAVVRRWPRSLPQYAVGHLVRMAELDGIVRQMPGLWLLGNGYRGVGLPDLIREARAAVAAFAGGAAGKASQKKFAS